MPNGPSHKIKQFFRSAFIPPWLRDGIPVLEWEGEPVALGDWVIAFRLKAWLAENGLEYRWHPANPVLKRLRADSQRG
jgi:tRNA(Ile)-lysidine synthetase-like protein